MIPKKIHYCWFGNNHLPKNVRKYIETWKKYCPDYEIIEWNETNFDITQNKYCYEAYKAKKWAFVSDYARLKVLYEYGGVYLDTDVEIIKKIDNLLLHRFFAGLESENTISTAVLAAEKNSEIIEKFLLIYNDLHFLNSKKKNDYTTNVERFSEFIKHKYNKELSNPPIILFEKAIIYDIDFFSVKNIYDNSINVTNNTYMIHHFSGSWLGIKGNIKKLIKFLIAKMFGKKMVKFIKELIKKGKL